MDDDSDGKRFSDYDSALFGCFKDVPLCVKYWCLPCCAVGWNAAQADGRKGMDWGFCIGACFCLNIFTFVAHLKVIDALGIEENVFLSLVKSFCCTTCTLCQGGRAMDNAQEGTIQPRSDSDDDESDGTDSKRLMKGMQMKRGTNIAVQMARAKSK